jgi:hypothetical protein
VGAAPVVIASFEPARFGYYTIDFTAHIYAGSSNQYLCYAEVNQSLGSQVSRTVFAGGSGGNEYLYPKVGSSSPIAHKKEAEIVITGGLLAGYNVRSSGNNTIEVICTDSIPATRGGHAYQEGSHAYVNNWELTATAVSSLNPAGAAPFRHSVSPRPIASPSATGPSRSGLTNRFVRPK